MKINYKHPITKKRTSTTFTEIEKELIILTTKRDFEDGFELLCKAVKSEKPVKEEIMKFCLNFVKRMNELR